MSKRILDDSMTAVQWEAPEPATRSGSPNYPWGEVVEQLKERPGVWALVAEQRNSSSAHRALKSRGCEVTSRGVDQKTMVAERIYARWPKQMSA